MKAKKLASWSILVVIVLLLGLEGWLLSNKEDNDTISEVVHETSKRWMIIPILTGMLIGHFFWPIYSKDQNVSK